MTLAAEIICGWLAISIVGAGLWAFHRRHARQAEVEFDGWVSSHPDLPLDRMPTEIGLRYLFQ